MNDVLRIEDDDGFATEWPWPEGVSMLHGAAFVANFQQLHDQSRAEVSG